MKYADEYADGEKGYFTLNYILWHWRRDLKKSNGQSLLNDCYQKRMVTERNSRVDKASHVDKRNSGTLTREIAVLTKPVTLTGETAVLTKPVTLTRETVVLI